MTDTSIEEILSSCLNQPIRIFDSYPALSGHTSTLTQTSRKEWKFTVQNESGEDKGVARFPVDFVSRKAFFSDFGCSRKILEALKLLFESEQSTDSKIPDVPRFSSVREFQQYFTFAYSKEMYQVFTTETRKERLFFGILVQVYDTLIPPIYEYQFDSVRQLSIPANTEVTLHLNHLQFTGTVLSTENMQIIVQTTENLGKEIEILEISTDMVWLTRHCENRSRFICQDPSPLVKDLILNGRFQLQDEDTPLKTGQKQARTMINKQPITCIWGPPGTGKTTTLCYMITDCFHQQRTVLVTAFSNAALDQALEKLLSLPSFLFQPGEVIRYGSPFYASISSHPYLTLDNYARFKDGKCFECLQSTSALIKRAIHIDKLKPEKAAQQLASLQNETSFLIQKICSLPDWKEDPQSKLRISRNTSAANLLLELKRMAALLRQRIENLKIEALSNAKIVFATSSAVIASTKIQSLIFDTVFFDEISMAPVPEVMIVAQCALNHFVCLGDFNQLPPTKSSGLQVDAFRYFGIVDALQHNRGHNWLVMLDTQYRMNSQISSFISMNYYFDKLKTAPKLDLLLEPKIQQAPFPGSKIVLIDCSDFHTCCKVLPSHSRVNILSALLATALAIIASKTSTAAVISPYNAQSLMIRSVFRDLDRLNLTIGADSDREEPTSEIDETENLQSPDLYNLEAMNNNLSKSILRPFATPSLHEIKAATVHSFQGSESDVVILDMTDCYKARYVSRLLSGGDNDLANRLFNVSLSRAKAKLIVLVHRRFFTDKLSPVRKKSAPDRVLLLNKFFNWMDFNSEDKLDLTEISGDELEQQLRTLSQMASKLTPVNSPTAQPIFQYLENKGKNWNLYLRDLQDAKSRVRIDLPGPLSLDQKFYLLKMKAILEKKQNSPDFKVIIRVQKEKDIPKQFEKIAIVSQEATDPATVIDKTITWYGMPRCVLTFQNNDTIQSASSRNPVFRLEGKFVSYQIEQILSMRDQDAYQIVGLKDEFDLYLAKHSWCPECGSAMHLVSNRNNLFLGCTDYPNCKFTAPISEKMVTEFIEQRKGSLICPICGAPLQFQPQKKGKDPLQFVCSQNIQHNFTFAELA